MRGKPLQKINKEYIAFVSVSYTEYHKRKYSYENESLHIYIDPIEVTEKSNLYASKSHNKLS